MDYYKLYCSEHPCDLITNFCTDPACLLGLCATCICQHTQNHIQRGTPPRYENIKNTYSRYNQRMRNQIELIEQDKDWLNDIEGKIGDKKRNVQDTLRKARNDCIEVVNRHFDDLQAKITAEIVSEGKRNSLHSSYRLETLNTLMIKELSTLLHFSQDLSSTKFIESAKIAEEEVFPNSKDFHLKLCKELKENEVYTASAIYREDLLGELSFSLKRLVNLEFLLPRVEYVEGPPKLERADEPRRPNSLRKNNSTSAIYTCMRQSQATTPNKIRNICSLLPKHTTSIIMPPSSYPFQQLMTKANEVMSPMTRSSRLAPGLKIIRESKRQSLQGDEFKSMTSSNVSYTGKQNEGLAHSMFIDTGSSFYR